MCVICEHVFLSPTAAVAVVRAGAGQLTEQREFHSCRPYASIQHVAIRRNNRLCQQTFSWLCASEAMHNFSDKRWRHRSVTPSNSSQDYLIPFPDNLGIEINESITYYKPISSFFGPWYR